MPTAALLNQGQLGLDDGSGDWWSGVQSFTLSAVLAVALSVTAIGASARQAFGQWQDEVPQAVADEAFWQNPVAPVPAIFYQNYPYLPDSEEIPASGLYGQPDEDFWQNPTAPVKATLGAIYLPDPEEIPAAQLSATVDEYYWQNEVAPVKATLGSLYLPDPEEIPSGNLSATVDEYFWVNSVPPIFSYSVPAVFSYDDVIVPQVAAFVPDEDFWVNPVLPALQTSIVPSLNIDSQEPTLFGQFDEDFWQNAVQPVQAALAWPQQFTFDVQEPSGSLFGQPDEDFWKNWVAPVQASLYQNLPYLPDPEEIPAGSLIPPVPPVPPSFQSTFVGRVIADFGVTKSNPAEIDKFSASQQTFVTTGTPYPPFPARADGWQLLGQAAMGGELLVAPSSGGLSDNTYYAVLGGDVTIPASAINTSLVVTLFENYFSEPGQVISIQSDPLVIATIPTTTGQTVLWSLVVRLRGNGVNNGILIAEQLVNGQPVGVLYSNRSQTMEPKLQLSAVVNLQGSGPDLPQVRLMQFQLQE